MIYLDHNATTPVAARVFEAMVPFFQESWGNPSSPYRFGNQARAAVEQARKRIADCIGCQPAELLFCSSGTESDNLALRGVARALRSKGNHEELAALAHRRGVVFHTDAVQSAGKLPRRLAELGADLVTFSAHKLYGPKGAAALYVREGTPLASVTTGGAQEHGLRAGTENVASIVGLAEAAALAFEKAESEGGRLRALRDRLERGVTSAVRGVRINGATAPRVPNTSSLSFQDIDGESIVLGLDVQGICVSTGSACSTGEPEASHVLRAMGLSPRDAQGTIRVSLGRATREEDVDTTARALMETVARLRQISSVRGAAE